MFGFSFKQLAVIAAAIVIYHFVVVRPSLPAKA